MHAVDATGVHPLLLAIGSERYVPYARPARAAGAAHPGQRHPGPGPAVARQVPVHRAPPTTRPTLVDRRHPGVLRAICSSGCDLRRDLHFQTAHHDRHARLLGRRAQPGVQAGDRGGRAKPRRTLPARRARPSCGCPTASGRRASACRACWPCAAPAFQPAAGDEVARAIALLGEQTAARRRSRW